MNRCRYLTLYYSTILCSAFYANFHKLARIESFYLYSFTLLSGSHYFVLYRTFRLYVEKSGFNYYHSIKGCYKFCNSLLKSYFIFINLRNDLCKHKSANYLAHLYSFQAFLYFLCSAQNCLLKMFIPNQF